MSDQPQASQGEDRYEPSIDNMISLHIPNRSKVSPDGAKTAYTVRTTDWRRNRFESKCYIHDAQTDRTYQLTRSGDVTDFHWINDESLAVLLTEDSDKNSGPQVWLFESLIGEALGLTDTDTGLQGFKPFARGILLLADNSERRERKKRGDKYGNFVHFEQEDSPSALYYTSIEKTKEYMQQMRRGSEEEAKKLPKPVLEITSLLKNPLKIVSFIASPSGDAIYLNCRLRDDLVYRNETSHFQIILDPEKALEEHLIQQQEGSIGQDSKEDRAYIGQICELALPKGAEIVDVSPDGRKLLIYHRERDNLAYTKSDLWTLDIAVAEGHLQSPELPRLMRKISQNIDRDLFPIAWTKDGIYVSYQDHTTVKVARLGEKGEVWVHDFGGIHPSSRPHITQNGMLTFVGTNATKYWEVYRSNNPITSPSQYLIQLTSYGKLVDGWDFGTRETIKWKSRDGTEIEGILYKPSDFDPKRKYPMVFVVQGGPRDADSEYLLQYYDYSTYPSIQFVNKGILVLKPNYRGQSGRGQAFTELNKENLGVGDLWDIESAIDYLDSLGIIDTTRVGCMGWSQGGYISAFATTHSDRFKATSVGGGVSDWYTYHISNDNPSFTTAYLSGTPFKDRSLYIKTSPMSAIAEANTPTLIQHGAKDPRVPLSNATELYRGLKDMNVPVELFIYPEMAHSVTKPRENRAVMHQNLTWFSHYLLGEKLDFEY
jgi:prolyl oligopeptidase